LARQILAGVKKLINEISPSAPGGTKAYLSAWIASACDVLEKITGTAFTAVDLTPQEVAQEAETLREKGVWLRFTVEKALKGEQSFGIGKSHALHLAQILMGEPFDPAQDFSSDYQDALAELFRQFAGAAALALKPRVGGEVGLQWAGYDPGNWEPQVEWGFRLRSEGEQQLLLVTLLDPDLGESLAPAPPPKAALPPAASNQSPSPPPAVASTGKRNINLLLDVELPVALRFGKREMPLGDILELAAGAVVELDQKILEPVELLVGGKVVAHGEVVVLDGHYALRVTEVLNPVERIESLQAEG
jgi:flagellar motor switch protein FliN/FliY